MQLQPNLISALHGVGVTPVTPFTSDLTGVDSGGLRSNIGFLIDSGVGLIYPVGNTGEAMSLSEDEWTQVISVSVEACAGRAAVVAGISQEYPVAITLARKARSLGVDGLLLMPRTQPYVSSQGLIQYWRQIMEAAGMPVVLYLRGLPDLDDLLGLLEHEEVVACKYADRDISRFATAVAGDKSGIVWTCGLAERYAPYFWSAGAVGFTSGLANFAPKLGLDMHDALRAGASTEAERLRMQCTSFEEIRARNRDIFNVAAVKTAMDEIGLAGGKVRPPLVDLDAAGRRALQEVLPAMTDGRV